MPTFYTPVANGAAANAATVNAPLAEIDTKLAVSLDADGTLKAGAVDNAAALAANVVTTTKILDANVTTAKIADVNVTGAKVAPTALGPGANAVFDPFNRTIQLGHNFDGRTRWNNEAGLSIVDDATNPFGSGKTLRLLGAGGGVGGKLIYLDEAGLRAGDVVRATIYAKAASGGYTVNLRPFDAANVATAAAVQTSVTMAGATQVMTTPTLTIPAATTYLIAYMSRDTGTADLDVYGMSVSRGDYAGVYTAPEAPELFAHGRPQTNLVDDPFNEMPHLLGIDWGGRSRWVASTQASIIINDTSNPNGGNTYRSTTGISAGKIIHMREKGIQVGDTITCSALIASASAGTGTLRARYIKADGSVCSDTSPTSTSRTVTFPTTTPQRVTVVLGPIPSDAEQIWIYVARGTGTPAIDVYEWWITLGKIAGPRATPALSSYAQQSAIAAGVNLAQLNEAGLRQWHYKLARIIARQAAWKRSGWTDTTPQQAVVAFLGHSWVARKNLYAALATYLRTNIGDGGNGWVSAADDNSNGVLYGATWVRVGTWTDVDAYGGSGQDLTAKGLDLMHATSTDVATPAKITIASSGTANTAFVIHWLTQPSGGSFRYRVDAGGWTTVATAGGSTLASTTTISGLSDATHTLEIEVTVAGSGVTLMGVDLQRTTGDGVRLHKLGNGSVHTAEFAGVDATIWQSQLTAIGPDLIPILCLTNDRSGNVVPSVTAANLSILVDRCRAAVPLADILLISDAATGDSATYGMDAYDQVVRDLAVRKSTAFLSGYELMNPYTSNKSRHLLTPDTGGADSVTGDIADNGRHLTDIGAQLLASAMYKLLRAS